MRRNAFNEPILETVDDFNELACEDVLEDVYAIVAPTGNEGEDDKFAGEVCDNDFGESVAWTKGFATREEVHEFLRSGMGDDVDIQDQDE